MYLFFDTETTGRPRNYSAPVTNLDNWPRILQLGFALYDKDRNLVEEKSFIISPPEGGFKIEAQALQIHGISNQRCEREGLPLQKVLESFFARLKISEYLIAHNFAFDSKVLGAEVLRSGLPITKQQYKPVCTMASSSAYVGIVNFLGFKWPKLEELHKKLFGTGVDGAHDALEDVRATARCFFALVDKGIIEI